MLNVSTEFRNEMMNDNRSFIPLVDITLKDGTVLRITDKEIWSNSFSIEDATSDSESFKIGALVSTKLSFILNNIYEDYSDYDFAGSTATAFISKKLDDGTTEKLQINVFRACDPDYNGSTITIAYYDNSTKLNTDYSKCVQTYPATLGDIAQSACSTCGITLLTTTFPNSDYVVQNRPEDSAITCADVISFVAQMAGCFAKCDHNGALYFGWYDFKVFENNITGGKFDSTASTSYQTGSSFDGGNLTDYASGDTLNGGTFTESQNYLVISNQKSLNVATDNVVITGISVTEDFVETDTEKITTYLSGSDGYVLSITDNPLIQYGKAKIVADFIYAAIGGMTFRPFSAELLSDPTIESGDIAYVSDRKGNLYNTVITYRKFTNGSGTSVSCEAETPERNSEVQYSAATKAVVKARQETDVKLSNYDLAVQQLTTLMSQSFGVFKTQETQSDGSTIYYMHNKPTLAASAIRWKFTAGALAVSTDYGQTWNAGIDSNGNAVVNVLNAIGINADWINVGTVKAGRISSDYTAQMTALMNSKISQSADEINIRISNIDKQNETYFNFTDTGIEIGKKNTDGVLPYSIVISNEKMSFMQSGYEVAYIQYNKLHINNVEAMDRMSVGSVQNGGYFDFISNSDGLGIKWRGAET